MKRIALQVEREKSLKKKFPRNSSVLEIIFLFYSGRNNNQRTKTWV